MVDRMGTESRARVDFSEEIYTRELTRGVTTISAPKIVGAPSPRRELVVILQPQMCDQFFAFQMPQRVFQFH
jgi:hypothetical protein